MKQKQARHKAYSLVALALGALFASMSAETAALDEIQTRQSTTSRVDGAQFDAWGRLIWSPEVGRKSYDRSVSPPLAETSPPSQVPVGIAGGPQPLQFEWYGSVLGVGIGDSVLEVVDLDGDLSLEILAGGGNGTFGDNDSWNVLARSGAGYELEFSQFPTAQVIQSARVAQMDADAEVEILVGLPGKILIYSGAGYQLERTLTVAGAAVKGLAVGDVDQDGQLEIVYCDNTDLFIYNAGSGTLEHQVFGLGGEDLAVGQADTDAALEIAIANGGQPGYVLDGVTRTVQWGDNAGFGALVRFGDLDGDGRDELVAGFAWSGLSVYDIDTGSLAYSVQIFNLAAILLADVEGDGPMELIYGDAQWGDIHVLVGTTGVEKWSVANPEHGVTRIAVADVDNDGVREVLWGAGHTSTGPDYLYVADAGSHAIEWQSIDQRGPFYGFDHGDIDADGAPELLTTSFDSRGNFGGGYYVVRNAVSKAVEQISSESIISIWRAVTANLDLDPQLEICIAGADTYTGKIFCFDGLTAAQEWQTSIPSGLTFRSMAVADLDSDGDLEIVAGVGGEHTGAPGSYVYAYQGATGFLHWRSPDLGIPIFSNLSLLRVADVDADPDLEVLVAAYGNKLEILDGVTGGVQLAHVSNSITSLATHATFGKAEILVGTSNGTVVRLDPLTGSQVEVLASYPGASIEGLAAVDVDQDGGTDLLFCRSGFLKLHDEESNSTLWESFIGTGAGANNSLVVTDYDADDTLEVLVNNQRGLAIYQVGAALPLFADGFETGDLSRWSKVP